MKRELISRAVARRVDELLGKRVTNLAPDNFGGLSEFVSSVRRTLLNNSSVELKNLLSCFGASNSWLESQSDCLTSLRQLALAEPTMARFGSRPPLEPLLQDLKTTSQHQRRFHLLTERYACPLNFTLPIEDELREYVLLRLMVHDRTRIEKESVFAVDSDNLLLELNLVAVHAATGRDLRFLDALNYYYELLPATWHPQSQHGWLLTSYFALYARALMAWL